MLFDLPPLADLESAFAGRLADDGERRVRRVLLDTFDWRLWSDGCTLSFLRDDQGCRLLLDDGGTPYSAAVPDGPAGFIGEVAGPRLAARIAGPVGIRCLLPVVEIDASERPLRLLDADGKTVVRLVMREGVARTPGEAVLPPDAAPRDVELPPSLDVLPVRGYDEEARRVRETLENELRLAPRAESLHEQAMTAIGRRPGDYSSKLRLALEPGISAGAATRQVLIHLLETIRRNEDGARRNLDSEFLHDLRVAVRRTRSVLAQMKGVIDAEAVRHFKAELKWLGQLTGPVRDLDVQRLHLPTYRTELPADHARALDTLERFLEQRHAARRKEMLAGMSSPRYRRLLADWQHLLESPLESPAEDAGDEAKAARPAVDVVRERIDKLHQKVLEKGSSMDERTPMPDLHGLRIECKKLRYLLELFGSLFAPGEVEAAVKRLRSLQNTLGKINDLAVQQRNLSSHAEDMGAEGIADATILLAIGRIVERMAVSEKQQRGRFAKRFGAFADKARRHPPGTSLAARTADS